MSRILLDTSAYSAFMSGSAGAVRAVREAEEIYLNATVMGETLAAFMGGTHVEKNRTELGRFLESPRVNVIAVDDETAERYAVILSFLRRAGTPLPTNDIWIAASAMQYGLRVTTLDRHFLRVPQVVTSLLD